MIKKVEDKFISIVAYINKKDVNKFEHFSSFINAYFNKYFRVFEIIFVLENNVDINKTNTKTFGDTIINFIKLSKFAGIDNALYAGKQLAIGDFIYEFETLDINYPPSLLYEMYKLSCKKGIDIISLSSDNSSLLSRFKSWCYGTQINCTFEDEPVRLISRRAINRINTLYRKNLYRKIEYASCGLPQQIIYYKYTNKHTSMPEFHLLPFFLYSTILDKVLLLIYNTFIVIAMIILYFKKRDTAKIITDFIFNSIVFSMLFLILKYLRYLLKGVYLNETIRYETIEKGILNDEDIK